MAKPTWKKIDPSAIGTEVPFQIRGKNREATVVYTQHGQLLSLPGRKLVEWMPEEMSAIPAETAEAEERPAASSSK